jgi:type VI protein secretion system component Hcp
MAVDMFPKIDRIPGESTDARHRDEIDVLSYYWGNRSPQQPVAQGRTCKTVEDSRG